LNVYADSSFIVALYLSQQSSPAAAAFMQRHGDALPFTPWHRLEVRNALRLAVFHKLIDSRQAKTQLKQVETDLQDETLLVHAPVDWVSVLRAAEKLGALHSEQIGCRSGDLFHIAAAVEWAADLFLTFDERQQKMAKAAGLAVKFS
jgi:predicted nucleic acid-binding protein